MTQRPVDCADIAVDKKSVILLHSSCGRSTRDKAQIPLGSSQLDTTRLDTFDFVEPVESCSVERDECVKPCFSNMVDDEEAVLLACTSFIVCALCAHVNKKEKKTTRSVGERLSQKNLLNVLHVFLFFLTHKFYLFHQMN